ncbi:hypothetical protein SAMN05216243_3293 [Sediminibacillus albus]|uniref:Uncharacterized protein n=1 Tax=Sediminibacillus albus TaxID=407036 RepID=A0A1G9C895_9BACI|nr:hypothetical protein SAMN05216243_3293 [Sediminibacillus albus]
MGKGKSPKTHRRNFKINAEKSLERLMDQVNGKKIKEEKK